MANAQLWGQQQFFYSVGTNIGQVLAGGTINFYAAGGTLTPKPAYTSSAGSSGTSYPNPLTLDSGGFASISSTRLGIWMQGFYRVQVYDINGILQFDWDQVSGGDASTTATQTIAIPFINTQNFINNSSFQQWSYNPTTITAVATTVNFADGPWYSMSQSNPVSYTQSTGTGADTLYSALQTQSNASGQRMGICQFTSTVTSLPIIGNNIFAQIAVNSSTSQSIGMALLTGVGVTDSTFVANVVNNWSSATYTQTNFFSSSGSIALLATSLTSVTAATTKLITLSGTVPTNTTGIYLFVWTAATCAQGVTVNYSKAAIYEAPTALNWRPPSASLDSADSLWKTLSNTYQAAPVAAQTVTATPSLYQTAVGYLAAGIAWINSGFTHSWTNTTLTANRTAVLPNSSISSWVLQRKTSSSVTQTSTTTTLAIGTTPTTSNTVSSGAAVTITPQLSTNPIQFIGSIDFYNASAANIGAFLFQGTTLIWSGVAGNGSAGTANIGINYVQQAGAGATSAQTYTLYVVSSTGTLYYGNSFSSTNWTSSLPNNFQVIEWSS
jgi:hypothetical protein